MLSINKFQMTSIASIGYLFEIHPGLTNRDRLHFFVNYVLNLVDMDDDELKQFTTKNAIATEVVKDSDDDASMMPKLVVPGFELLVSTVGFGNGND